MTDKLVVDFEAIRSTANQIKGLKEQYHTEWSKLYDSVNAIGSAWQGEDNQAYVNQINGFKDDFTRMEDTLEKFIRFLTESAAAYEQVQDNVKSAAQGLTS